MISHILMEHDKKNNRFSLDLFPFIHFSFLFCIFFFFSQLMLRVLQLWFRLKRFNYMQKRVSKILLKAKKWRKKNCELKSPRIINLDKCLIQSQRINIQKKNNFIIYTTLNLTNVCNTRIGYKCKWIHNNILLNL